MEIQDAIDVASAGDTILVADGTYSGNDNKNIDFLGKNIVVMSENGADSTIIDCEGIGFGFYLSGGDSTQILQGFTVTNASADAIEIRNSDAKVRDCKIVTVTNGTGIYIPPTGDPSPRIENCVVEGCANSGMRVNAGTPTITGCTFRDNQGSIGGGLYLWGCDATVSDCVFTGNEASVYGGGVAVYDKSEFQDCTFANNISEDVGGGIWTDVSDASGPRFTNCTIKGNTAAGGGGGASLNSGADTMAVFTDCTITGNVAGGDGGGIVFGSGPADIIGCTVAGNRASGNGGGFWHGNGGAETVTVTRTIVWGNCAGLNGDEIRVDWPGQFNLTCCDVDSTGVSDPDGRVNYVADNIVMNPFFCDAQPCDSAATTFGDYQLAANSRCLASNSSCGQQIGAKGASCTAMPLRVPGDFTLIQDAIDAAFEGDTILVGDGTYTGVGNKDLTFDGKGIVLRSENGADSTIIDCEGSGRGITFDNAEDDAAVLDGFRIVNGSVSGAGNERGGGIFIDTAYPTIRNCVIDNCTSYWEGGGIYITDWSATNPAPEFSNCVVNGNTAWNVSGSFRDGGGVCIYMSSASFNDCDFNNNEGDDGAGVYLASSNATFDGCRIGGNVGMDSGAYGGGLYVALGNPSFTNTMITENTAVYGGGVYVNGNAAFTNCEILHNVGDPGGGVYVYDAEPSFTNCTVAGNRSDDTGGGFFFDAATAIVIDRTIVWGNGAALAGDEVMLWGDSDVTFTCCNVDTTGVGEGGGVNSVSYSNLVDEAPGLCAPIAWTRAPTGGGGDYRLSTQSPCLASNSPCGQLIGAPLGTGCTIRMLRVPDNWATIQDGINSAFPDDTVLVAPGTYSGAGNRDLNFAGKNIVLVSEKGADSTIIDCEGSGRGFLFENSEDTTSVVQGFTIVNGYAGATGGGIQIDLASSPKIEDCVVAYCSAELGRGGGIYVAGSDPIIQNTVVQSCSASASDGGGIAVVGGAPTIAGCTFNWNYAEDSGGGLYSNGSAALLSGCVFTENTTSTSAFGVQDGGGMAVVGGTPTINGCEFAGNYANGDGGGLRLNESDALVSGCVFQSNTADGNGGGTSVYEDSAKFWDCAFVDNTGLEGGGIYAEVVNVPGPHFTNCAIAANVAATNGGGAYLFTVGGELTAWFTNCTITGNYAVSGGGIGLKYASVEINGCTIAGNRAEGTGGGIRFDDYWFADVSISRTIVWGNCAGALGGEILAALNQDGTINFTCCDIDSTGVEVTGGGTVSYVANNIFEDPLFCDPIECTEAPTTAGDYTISTVSQALSYYNTCGANIGALGAACGHTVSTGIVKDGGTKIDDNVGGFGGEIGPGDEFGRSVVSIGDLDGDGVTDVAVGASHSDDGGTGPNDDRGSVWILFMRNDGTVKAEQKISDTEGGFTGTLENSDRFGTSVASLGDLDGPGSGVVTLAVGAPGDDDGGESGEGAIWLLYLNADGNVNYHEKISETSGGFTETLDGGDEFGSSLASLGDFDGDAVPDMVVGRWLDDDGGTTASSNRGAVYMILLNANGTVKSYEKISDAQGNFAGVLDDGDWFGTGVTSLGDFDGDGVDDLAVGAPGDNNGRGAVWLLFMNSDGTVKSHVEIGDGLGGFVGALDDDDNFGYDVASMGDLDGDGVGDLAVGARMDDDGGTGDVEYGAVWILYLNENGTVKSHQKISATEGGFSNGTWADPTLFGTSVAPLGDIDRDGVPDLAVGARADNGDGGGDDGNQGALWVLTLQGFPDGDRDGVPDASDGCVAENASFFDQDGDGCIDVVAGTRRIEFWGAEDFPVSYVINEEGAPYVVDGSDFTAIQSAMNVWPSVAGTDFSVTYAGTTPQQDAGALDQVNLVTFLDDEYSFGAYVLAVGITTSFLTPTTHNGKTFRPGQIVDSDIIFNPNKIFTTPTSGGSGTDMQSVATHEAGHLFGIAHSAVKTSTMFFVLPPGNEAASLSTEDSLAILNTYPDASTKIGNRLGTTVTDSVLSAPVPGAVVMVIDTATQDTIACSYTLPNGECTFNGIPNGDYYIAIHPMDGTAAVGGLIPPFVNALVGSTAVTLFEPEYWDVNEAAAGDDPSAKGVVSFTGDNIAEYRDLTLNIDDRPPAVVSVSPDSNVTDARIDAPLVITFSEAIELDSVTTNFSLTEAPSGPGVSGIATAFKDDSVLSFAPDGTLAFATTYKVTLDTGMSDLYGNGLAEPFVYQFTTEDQPNVYISSLVPSKGVVRSIVAINGVGFEATATLDTVRFNGVQTEVISASQTKLVVMVPDSATTGLVTVTVGSDTSAGRTFTVLSPTEVARGFSIGSVHLDAVPHSITVLPDGSYAFVATDAGAYRIVVHPDSSNQLALTEIPISGGMNEVSATPDGSYVFGVSRVNKKLYRMDPDALGVVPEKAIGDEPRGLVIGPAGSRAYIPTDKGELQVWDVDYSSVNFHKQVGVIASPDLNLRGKMAVDPGGDTLWALTGTGKLLAFDLNTNTVAAEIDLGGDPRDIVIDASGGRAYVCDETGIVTVVSLSLLQEVEDITVGGTPWAIAITPGGGFLHVANRELNLIGLIDLQESNSTYRSVAATIPLGVNPVDVVVSPDGLNNFSIIEAESTFVITAVGLGPTLRSLSREAGPVGTRLVFAGVDLGADTSQVRVLFNDQAAGPEAVTGNSVTVTVPAGAQSGPVKVKVGVTDPEFSNGIYFDVLGPTPSPGLLRLATKSELNVTGSVAPIVAQSPLGDQLAIGSWGGEVYFLDTDRNSSTLNQIVKTTTLTANNGITDVAFTPDGRKAYVTGNAGPGSVTFVAINSNRSSSGYGVATAVDFSTFSPQWLQEIAIGPDGGTCLIHDPSVPTIYFADIAAGSATENQVIDSLFLGALPPVEVTELVFHPGGEYVYVTSVSDQSVYIVDMRPEGGTFREIVNTVTMPVTGAFPQPEPLSLSFLPDGSECLVLVWDQSPSQNAGILTLDTSNPFSPTAVGLDSMFTGVNVTIIEGQRIDVSPRGDRAVLHLNDSGLHNISLESYPYPDLGGFYDPVHLGPMDHDFTPDGSAVYAVSTVNDSLMVYDFTSAAQIEKVSSVADSLPGVIDQTLSMPVKVKVTDSGALPVSGVAVTFEVTRGGGLFPENSSNKRVVSTDSQGLVETQWMLGSLVDPDSQIVTASAQGLTGSPVRFRAHAFPDPNTLDLVVSDVKPSIGSDSVSVTTAVQVTFNRAVDTTTVDGTTFYMRKSGESTPVAATTGVADGNRKLSLTPRQALDYNSTYVIEITSGLEDEGGDTLVTPMSANFDTDQNPSPLDLSSVQPISATKGVKLVLAGKGFDKIASNNTVLFGDVPAAPTEASVDFLKVVVPPGAKTDSIRVQVGTDTSNALPFTVLVPSNKTADDVIGNLKGASPTRGVAITPDGTLAYAVSPNAGAVIPIDVKGLGAIKYPSIQVGSKPYAVVIHPEGGFAYVVNHASGSVSIIDVGTNLVVKTLLVGNKPVDLVVSPDGDRLYTANLGSKTVSEIDTDKSSKTHHKVLANMSPGVTTRSISITPDGTRLYVGTNTGYVIIDPVKHSVIGNMSGGQATRSVSITPDGTLVIVLTVNGDVLIVDGQKGSPTENQVIGNLGTGSATRSISITPDGTLLYLTQEVGDVLYVVKISVLGGISVVQPGSEVPPTEIQVSFLDTLSQGEDPADIAFDPSGTGLGVLSSPGDSSIIFLSTPGLPTGIAMSDIAFFGESGPRAAVLSWVTTSERNLEGFHLLRSDEENGGYERISTELIPARGSLTGSDYSYRDAAVVPNQTYYYKVKARAADGSTLVFGPYEFVYRARFALEQNFPNPFNPTTKIRFTIPENNAVKLTIYDVKGRRIRTLVNGPLQANHYEVQWNSKNDQGQSVASGVYFYKLEAGAYTKTRKMVLLK